MIKAVMMMNTQGKPRLAKFYDFLKQHENVSNFLEIDSLFGPRMSFAVLDLIHVLVEILDKCLSNVCELFNYSKMHTVLDEIVFGGQVLETSSTEVIKAVENISKAVTDLELVADVEIELELGADLEVVTELEAEMVVQLGQEWKLEIGEFAE
ncbi:hypothetical protein Bca52824_077020 [Brassica carinata]|uniref:AP complex mu/sigma subunit domain-containing protein n=1 Tax=Brassica carinata TaxID=52824 RepID=A0A8X7PTC0_BRACI|nr:hypothetical protein Bca52824_077020 [Brassica carinata]